MKLSQKLVLILTGVYLISACNKTEGPGGTSTVRGTVTGQEFSASEAEVTEVIVSPGSELEHGDYWIINSPSGGTFYYIWYDNPTWITDGDPALSGRTGIPVEFNYSDSNTDIALNTANAISLIAGSDFEVMLENDIITLKNKTKGVVADANNMTTAFEVNIANQGEEQYLSNSAPVADTRVYIVYGEAAGYGDEIRTGGDGDFSFTNLVKGNYSVYVVSKDTLSDGNFIKNEVEFEIIENKSIIEDIQLHVIY